MSIAGRSELPGDAQREHVDPIRVFDVELFPLSAEMEFAEGEARSQAVHEVGAVFAEGAYPEARIDTADTEARIPGNPACFGIEIERSEVEPAHAHEVQAIGIDLQI